MQITGSLHVKSYACISYTVNESVICIYYAYTYIYIYLYIYIYIIYTYMSYIILYLTWYTVGVLCACLRTRIQRVCSRIQYHTMSSFLLAMPSGAFLKGHIRPTGSGWLAVVAALEEQTIIFEWARSHRMIRMRKRWNSCTWFFVWKLLPSLLTENRRSLENWDQ